MALPVGFVNVALSNAGDSGNVSLTVPSGAKAWAVFGTYYDGNASQAVTSFTGSGFTTDGLIAVGSTDYMGAYLAWGRVNTTGSQTVRLQKPGFYFEGPTCQIAFFDVADSANCFRLAPPNALGPQCVGNATGALTRSTSSQPGDLVVAWTGCDGGGTLGSITDWTQQGSEQITNADKGRVYTRTAPAGSSTSITGPANGYPTLGLIAVYDAAGGGTTYNDSVSETVTVADARAAAAVFASARAESVTLADARSSAAVFVSVRAEPVVVADGLSVARVMAASYSEGVSTSDGVGGAQQFTAALSDAVTLADQYASSVTGGGTTYNEVLSEALTLADGLVAAHVMQAALAENAALADTLIGLGLFGAALTEPVTPDTALLAGRVMPASVSESVAVGDSSAGGVVISTSLAEAIAMAEALGATQVMLSAVGETTTLTAQFDATVTVPGGYPDPADVREGVTYGPTGVEYTGTFKGGKGVVWIRRR